MAAAEGEAAVLAEAAACQDSIDGDDKAATATEAVLTCEDGRGPHTEAVLTTVVAVWSLPLYCHCPDALTASKITDTGASVT